MVRWWSGAVAVVMACAGLAVTLTSARAFEPLWQVWATLAISLCGAAGLVGAYGLAAWRRLSAHHRLPRHETVLPTVVAGIGALVVLAAGEVFSKNPGSGWRGDILVILTVSAGGFAGAAMFGVRVAVKAVPVSSELAASEATVVALTDLRRRLHRLASALGSLVTLSTLALGAGVLLSGNQARELVVVFGGGGAATIAAFYVPAAVAIRVRGEALLTAVLGTREPKDTAELVEHLEQRAKLEQHLGVDRTLFGDLQAAIPVLGPLVAAAAVFLPK